MGRINPIPGQGLAVRLALFRADASDGPIINAAAYSGEIERVAPGVICLRNDAGRVANVQKVSAATLSGTRYVLALVYTPAATRDDVQAFVSLAADFGADLVKSWRVIVDSSGALLVPVLDGDLTAIGVGVKNNLWPATWRVRLPTDAEGSPPTGPRACMLVVA